MGTTGAGEGSTARPWVVEDDTSIFSADGAAIASMFTANDFPCVEEPADCAIIDSEAEANAALIVRAVNNHEALVEALRRLRNECDAEGLRNRAGFDCWLSLADAALSRVEGA